jgi:hypothetical protein
MLQSEELPLLLFDFCELGVVSIEQVAQFGQSQTKHQKYY